MNPLNEAVRIQTNSKHYNESGRLRAYCCGCIPGGSNVIFICFFWAVISFYFAVLAFLNKSPFYSYFNQVALIAFGAINLLFGIVTLMSMAIFLLKNHMIRMTQIATVVSMHDSRRTVFAITINALGVLIVTLANFILFIMDKPSFRSNCIDEAITYVNGTYIQENNNATIPANELDISTDIYNCDRLYQDEVKWSLLCLVIMSVVYVHWILIVAAKKTYNFYYHRSQMPPQAIIGEFANVAPSKGKKLKKLHIFGNMKPMTNIMRELLTHKQCGEFIPSEQQAAYNEKIFPTDSQQEQPNNLNTPKLTTSSNVICFEDNIYSSKEEIQQPINALILENIPSTSSQQSLRPASTSIDIK